MTPEDRNTKAWAGLIEYIKNHPFVTMTIEFKEAMPIYAEEIKESIKFS
jgi:hypothetical protein